MEVLSPPTSILPDTPRQIPTRIHQPDPIHIRDRGIANIVMCSVLVYQMINDEVNY
jgi:hypothetical protein